MRKIMCFFFFCIMGAAVFFNAAQAEMKKVPTVLRVAMFDNPSFYVLDVWGYTNYEQVYMLGVKEAFLYYQRQNLPFVYQTFFYGNGPLEVVKNWPQVKNWQPDFIIGPHYSNQFFMLRNLVKNTLIVSPYASDSEIAHLPANFQSNAVPDSSLVTIMQHLFKRFLPKKNILDLSEVDCKDCVDFSHDLDGIKGVKVKHFKFYGDKLSDVNFKALLAQYKPNDIIVLNVSNYLLAKQIVNRIPYQYPKTQFHFLNFLDNWGVEETSELVNSNVVVYRMFPDIYSIKEDSFKDFLQKDSEEKEMLKNQVSFTIFNSIRSVVQAYIDYGKQVQAHSLRERILKSYLMAIHKNKYWFKMRDYTITRVDSKTQRKLANIAW